MTITQAANYLRVSLVFLLKLEKTGQLVPERVGKRGDRMYTMDLLNQYLSINHQGENESVRANRKSG
jgi:DNA-binding transcriptional MerR regulator